MLTTTKFAAALTTALLTAGMASAQQGVEVKIGASLPLTGAMAAYGQDAVAGVRLAIADLNRQRLRIGGRELHWSLDAQDDQGDPRQATVVAQSFADTGVAGVVGPMPSGCLNASAMIYERARIPLVTPAATADDLALHGRAMFHRVLGNDRAIGGALIGYVLKQLHPHRVAIIDDRSLFGQQSADQFARAMQAAGIELAPREYTNDKSVDFRAFLTRIRATSPDLIYYGGYAAQGGPMLRQMRELGMTMHLVGGDAICIPELAKLAGEASSQLICANSGAPLDATAAGRDWRRRFARSADAAAYQAFAPFAYDATMVLAQAMISAASVDPKVYAPALNAHAWNGVTQRRLRFDTHGDLINPAVTVSTFRAGAKTAIDVIGAGSAPF